MEERVPAAPAAVRATRRSAELATPLRRGPRAGAGRRPRLVVRADARRRHDGRSRLAAPPLARGDRRPDVLDRRRRAQRRRRSTRRRPPSTCCRTTTSCSSRSATGRDAMDPGLPAPARVAEAVLAHIVVRDGLVVGGLASGKDGAADGLGPDRPPRPARCRVERAALRRRRRAARGVPRPAGRGGRSRLRAREGPCYPPPRRRAGRFEPSDSPGRDSSVGRARD